MKTTKLSVRCAVSDCCKRAVKTADISININNEPRKRLPVCNAHYDAAKEDTDPPKVTLRSA